MNLTPFLTQYPAWQARKQMLLRRYTFDDYLTGLDFLNDVASLAEDLGHHPDMLLQYRTVSLSLTTHEDGPQVTEDDVRLAMAIEQLYEEAYKMG
ncbi:4a-hydroxytetrahydrobiopterin dehydratase [Candidatus Peribacteria bacterium]|nr:4a-hydroxytetrahydrobiopterin dehydratase [Candidatus Peribacteria bacterium]